MKKFLFLSALLTLGIIGCDDDDGPVADPLDYSIMIHAPNTDDKHVNDTMHVHVDFASGTNETIHHVKVRIYNKEDGTEIYNAPSDAHVHTQGMYSYHDDIILSEINGVNAHTDWILEAKVWGHDAGVGELIAPDLEFHVHPE